MSSSTQHRIVGVFALAGLAALAALLLLFGRDSAWLSTGGSNTLHAHFPSAAGMRAGTLVLAGGLPVGRVVKVAFRDPAHIELGVAVVLRIDEPYRFRPGTVARTLSPGLGLGRPPVTLIPPAIATGELLASGAVIPGEIAPTLDALAPPETRAHFEKAAQQIGATAESLQPTLDVAARLLEEHGPQIAISSRELVVELRSVAAEVRATSSSMRQLMERGDAALAKFDERMAAIMGKLATTLDLVNAAAADLQRLAAFASLGEGTVGQLLQDRRAYEGLVVALQRLTELTEEMETLIKQWQEGRIRIGF